MAESNLTSYEPSLRDNIASLISNLLASDKYTKQTVNRRVGDVIDFVPGVGDVVGLDDASSSLKHGNYAKGSVELLSTLLGVVPGVGDAVAGSVKSGTRRMFHGTNSATNFSTPAGSLRDVGLHVTPDPNVASYYAGMDPYKEPTDAINGRIYPLDVSEGKVLEGFSDPINWNDTKAIMESLTDKYDGADNIPSDIQSVMSEVLKGRKFSDVVKSRGYDSVRYDHYPLDPYADPTEALMLLSPSSVMSAVGKAPYEGVRYNDDYDWLADWFKEN